MVEVLSGPVRSEDVRQLLSACKTVIKLAVDVDRRLVAGGGAFHADGVAALLEAGSQQESIWGADWISSTREVRCESLINVRPGQGNAARALQDASLRTRIEAVVRTYLDPS